MRYTSQKLFIKNTDSDRRTEGEAGIFKQKVKLWSGHPKTSKFTENQKLKFLRKQFFSVNVEEIKNSKTNCYFTMKQEAPQTGV